MKKKIILILIFLILSSFSMGQSLQDSINTVYPGNEFSKVATSIGQFLKLEYGAGGAGVAGAYTALAKGAVSMAWNPAGLGFVTSPELYMSQNTLYAGISSNYLGAGFPLGGANVLGISVQYMSSGDMEVTTLDYPDGTDEMFQANSMSLGLSFARRLTDRLSVGITGKYITESIYKETASTFGFDVGSNFDLGIYGLILGMSLQNFGGSARFDGPDLNYDMNTTKDIQGHPELTSRLLTDEWPLPIVFRMGLRADLVGGMSPWKKSLSNRFTLLVDANDPFDAALRGALGFEYAWHELFYVRGGYKIGYEWSVGYDVYEVEYNDAFDVGETYIDENDNKQWDAGEEFTDGLRVLVDTVKRDSWGSFYENGRYPFKNFSVGTGINYNLYGTKLLFDYSLSNMGILGAVQQVSLGMTF